VRLDSPIGSVDGPEVASQVRKNFDGDRGLACSETPIAERGILLSFIFDFPNSVRVIYNSG
jgi:hypothetical protein